MKKTFVLFICILLTGCFGETGQGYLNITCEKKDVINELTSINKIFIKHKDDKIVSMSISYRYETNNLNELDSIKQSKISESNMLKINAKINEDANSYETIYELDLSNDNVKKYFSINMKSSDQIKYYRNLNYICE